MQSRTLTCVVGNLIFLEIAMKTQQRFAEPVSIFVGLGFPYDVETAEQAYRVLEALGNQTRLRV
jgi:hypothetical protein